ncbi:MAG: TonB-dependent receptor plug domain-containing protein [Chlorobi bacterium]|nr:TonB-dependent receptor plug domain-containing protein [Chlorobiota bacterium]
MKIRPLVWNILWLALTLSYGQKITVTGIVYDAETKEKLEGAQIYAPDAGKGTVTNTFGFFSLQLPPADSVRLGISHIGYRSRLITVKAQPVIRLDVALEPGETLNEVVITADTEERPEKDVRTGKISLRPAEIARMPSIFSEPDLIKALQKMPGVEEGTEGTAGLYVRGGSLDQNFILIDDVPVYYLFHLGGFVSIFNPEAVKRITLYKGGFPVRYGERLSSVVDIRTRDGHKNEYHGAYRIGLLSWKFSLEGPVVKDRTSFMFSVRRFPYDIFLKTVAAISTGGEERYGYTFYDLNLKIHHRLGRRDNLYFTFYTGDDAVSMVFKYGIDKTLYRLGWGNRIMAVKWARPVGAKWFVNTTLSRSGYRYGRHMKDDWKTERYLSDFRYKSGITETRLQSHWEYRISPQTVLETGGGAVIYDFLPGRMTMYYREDGTVVLDTTVENFRYRSRLLYGYGALRIRPLPFAEMEGGIRLNTFFFSNHHAVTIEPRLNLKFSTGRSGAVKFSYTHISQPLHLLSSGRLGMPVDLWMPATDLVPPAVSRQIAAGYYRSWDNGRYDLSWEVYYKTMKGLIAYKPGMSFYHFAFSKWEQAVARDGTGYGGGSEILLRKRKGKWQGFIAYTYSRSFRRFEELNRGRPFPFDYDRPHRIDISAVWQWKPGRTLSLAWTYGSGYPVSFPSGLVYVREGNGGYQILLYTEKNNLRLRPYHRLDLSMQFTKPKRRGERTWIIGVYNAYNRKNPFFYTLTWQDGGYRLYQISLFPVLPSVAYVRRF